MQFSTSHSWSCCIYSSCVTYFLIRFKAASNMVLRRVPCSLILRLFLAPNNIFYFWIFSKLYTKQLFREWIKLLHPHNSHMIPILLPPFLQQIIIDLPTTYNHSSYLGIL